MTAIVLGNTVLYIPVLSQSAEAHITFLCIKASHKIFFKNGRGDANFHPTNITIVLPAASSEVFVAFALFTCAG